MKKIRLYASKWYLCLPMGLWVVITSCSKSYEKTVGNSTASSKYSGEELFNGIFFGKGDAAASISDYTVDLSSYASSEADKKGIENVETNIISTIRANDPSFFDNFKKEISSGVPAEVNLGLTTAAQKILSYFNPGADSKLVASKYANIKNEFIKDGGAQMTPKQAMNLMQNDKYKNMFASAVGIKTTSTDPNATSNINVVQTSILVAFYLVIAGAAVAVIVVAAVTQSSTGDALLQEQTVASITNAFKVKN